jgi:hypothetical protein
VKNRHCCVLGVLVRGRQLGDSEKFGVFSEKSSLLCALGIFSALLRLVQSYRFVCGY